MRVCGHFSVMYGADPVGALDLWRSVILWPFRSATGYLGTKIRSDSPFGKVGREEFVFFSEEVQGRETLGTDLSPTAANRKHVLSREYKCA